MPFLTELCGPTYIYYVVYGVTYAIYTYQGHLTIGSVHLQDISYLKVWCKTFFMHNTLLCNPSHKKVQTLVVYVIKTGESFVIL
jgi:hypothetical protein